MKIFKNIEDGKFYAKSTHSPRSFTGKWEEYAEYSILARKIVGKWFEPSRKFEKNIRYWGEV